MLVPEEENLTGYVEGKEIVKPVGTVSKNMDTW
jgi:hypothetical protein